MLEPISKEFKNRYASEVNKSLVIKGTNLAHANP
jgi:hypothetical protein